MPNRRKIGGRKNKKKKDRERKRKVKVYGARVGVRNSKESPFEKNNLLENMLRHRKF